MKKLVIAFAITGLAFGVTDALLWSDLRALQVETAKLRDLVTKLQLSARLVAVRSPGGAVPISASSVATAPATESRTPGPASTAAVIRTTARMQMKEGRAYELNRARESLSTLFPDFGRVLGLGPAELEKLTDLLARQVVERSIESETNSAGTATGQDNLRKLDERKRRQEAEIAAMLGDKYPQWQEYRKTANSRLGVRVLQEHLVATPLSNAQVDALVAAMDGRSMQLGGRALQISDKLSAAASVLSSQQYEGYRKMLEEQQNRALQQR